MQPLSISVHPLGESIVAARTDFRLFGVDAGGGGRHRLALDYAGFTKRPLHEFTTRPDGEAHLFTHVTGFGGANDHWPVLAQLRDKFRSAKSNVRFVSAENANSFMCPDLTFVIACQLHACIGAFGTGTPVVTMAYSRRFRGFVGSLGYSSFIDVEVEETRSAIEKVVA